MPRMDRASMKESIMKKSSLLIVTLALAIVGAVTPMRARASDRDASISSSTSSESQTPLASTAKDDPKSAKGGAAAKPADAAKGGAGDDKSFDDVVKDMEVVKGMFTFYRKPDENKTLIEVMPDQLDHVFLFAASIDQSSGERGFYGAQQGGDFAFTFHKVGKTVQWVMKNTTFVADPGSPGARSVARSFPNAILAAAKIQSKPHPERKSILIDAADLLVGRDLPGFAIALNQAYAPTNFSYDKDKSSITSVHDFPENVLFDVSLHYSTDNPRTFSVTLADARSVPITAKYEFSALRHTGYKPRLADDRVGHFLVTQQDFTSDHPQSPYTRYITRWNLEKQDPTAALSPPKQPIVYWLENTIPLEYRDAVRDGALLWNKAFEKIGIKDAVVVKQQPDSCDWDAADVRYNTIRWFAGVDATFAIGPSRADPFTGEIYDADVSISEGIIRYARRLGEEYISPVTAMTDQQQPVFFPWAHDERLSCDYGDGLAQQAAFGLAVLQARGTLSPELEKRFLYEYIVELTAHEVGHTLGLRHNFRGSSILKASDLNDEKKAEEVGMSSSVMDYNPVIIAGKGEKQGHFVPVTLGPYDYWAIEYAYKPIDGDEKEALAKIASRCADPMLPYSTDEDAIGTYSPISIDPLANQYDCSTDPLAYFTQRVKLVDELWGSEEVNLAHPGDGYQIMRRALARGLGDDYRSLVTSSKMIGGLYHHRDHVGDPNGRTPYEPVPAAKQREALDFLAAHAFGEKAFRLSPSLMNKLAIERIPGLDPAYFGVQRIDYPWHDQVLTLQRAVLNRLYHPITLARIQDNELRFGSNEKAFKMVDLFAGLNTAIWSELDNPKATEITSLRRNLQREQLKDLIRLTLREPSTVPAGGFGNAAPPPPAPEDATTLARSSLTRIQTKIKAKLLSKAALDATTRAYLQESNARIGAALTAQMQQTVD
jgi:hypothetical protein